MSTACESFTLNPSGQLLSFSDILCLQLHCLRDDCNIISNNGN